MVISYVGVSALTILSTAFVAVADLVRAPFVVRNAASVAVPATWLTPLGLVKAAGALGLLLGLLGVPLVGTAAAIGLTVFFAGAVAAHVRVGDRSARIGFPVSYLLLAAASLALGLVV